MKRIAIVGAGFSGAVIAHELASAGYGVDVFDARPHVAGNCHTERDGLTGVMVHNYGPHIFHTSNESVWRYIQSFDEFMPFTNRVLPINLLTINQFFGKTLSPAQAEAFIASIGDASIVDPQSFEAQALKFIGRDLYEAFFKGYTIKQWGTEPSNLPASILKRLPVRFNYDDNYYASTYQGMPRNGYTYIVERMLDHKDIHVHLNTRVDRNVTHDYFHLFYSGPIDEWYGCDEGRLGYRTLDFVPERHTGDFQGNAVINYCDMSVAWTRISEHKHFAPWEKHENTLIFREYSRECRAGDVPYYPIRLVEEKSLLGQYVNRARQEDRMTFVGRLGTYRYLDMHVAIAEALDAARHFLDLHRTAQPIPAFFVNPL
jgi:UDP-galactopyranose mutase